jgi:hypothetical protein
MLRKIFFSVVALAAACGPGGRHNGGNGGGTDGGGGSGSGSGTSGIPASCQDAQDNHLSVGCDYWAVDMDAAQGPPSDACFAVFVANTSTSVTHVKVTYKDQPIDLSQFAKLPVGAGTSLTYAAYDPNAGLAPGQVAILFLDYGVSAFDIGNVPCPVPAALGLGVQVHGTGVGYGFHVTTDNPVVAYQMLPYGGGAAAATGASLLIPSSAWDTNYVAVSAYDSMAPPIPIPMGPSHNVVAALDNTNVTMRPLSAISAGGGLPAGPANQTYSFTLQHGQYAQFTQADPLSGSPIQSDQPVGVFGGHQIMSIDRCCGDHGEQMLTPVRALGSEYVAAPHADRKPNNSPDPRVFRIYGAVDGTQLTYDPPGVGPATVNLGQMLEIRTSAPFVVRSQDSDHPFSMFTYMTGAGVDDPTDTSYDPNFTGGWGDPDFVRLVPPLQYLSHYVFFTDVTYPFTVLTVVRQQRSDGTYADVSLDCLGAITGWQPVGAGGQYEIAYVKLVDHFNAQGQCNNGVHSMDSSAPFGVWVWGWGSEDTNTGWVSYGYPAGEGVLPINTVVVQ